MLIKLTAIASAAFILVASLINVTPAAAQASADAFAGFRSDNKDPIQIEADSLEVLDTENRAVFKGNVDVRQGKTTMRTVRLDVYYDGSVSSGGGGSSQGIKRIEASGKVVVVSGKHQAIGDRAVFNMKTQVVVLTGDKVTLIQCDNVAQGKKLTVNLATNTAQLSGSRVQAQFDTGDSKPKNADKKCE